MTDMDPEGYYDRLGEGEWERLDRNLVSRMEFETTTDYLDSHLPKTGHVLDAGGGPGRYTCWLAERGYEVIHCDLSGEQTRIARDRAEYRGLDEGVTTGRADIRALPYESDSFDAVCCLGGPLSHVLDSNDRERALVELRRVARDDAPAFVSVIGRLAAARFGMKHGSHPGVFTHVATTGDYTESLLAEYDEEGWAECHFFRAAELESTVEAAGFEVETLVGLEGLTTHLQMELEDADDERIGAIRDVHRTLREERSVADTAEHILAVCRA